MKKVSTYFKVSIHIPARIGGTRGRTTSPLFAEVHKPCELYLQYQLRRRTKHTPAPYPLHVWHVLQIDRMTIFLSPVISGTYSSNSLPGPTTSNQDLAIVKSDKAFELLRCWLTYCRYKNLTPLIWSANWNGVNSTKGWQGFMMVSLSTPPSLATAMVARAFSTLATWNTDLISCHDFFTTEVEDHLQDKHRQPFQVLRMVLQSRCLCRKFFSQ